MCTFARRWELRNSNRVLWRQDSDTTAAAAGHTARGNDRGPWVSTKHSTLPHVSPPCRSPGCQGDAMQRSWGTARPIAAGTCSQHDELSTLVENPLERWTSRAEARIKTGRPQWPSFRSLHGSTCCLTGEVDRSCCCNQEVSMRLWYKWATSRSRFLSARGRNFAET